MARSFFLNGLAVLFNRETPIWRQNSRVF